MATSGTVDFSTTGTKIINRALFLINALEAGETIDATVQTDALDTLNMMVKQWQINGRFRWKKREGNLFLDGTSQSLNLGPNGAKAAKDAFVSTRLNGAHISSATAITVDSTTGMTAADNIGFELSDGTRFWDTIASVDTSTTLTLDTGLSGAASDNATVFAYTTAIERPVRILDVRRKVFGGSDVPIDLVPRDVYFDQPSKDTTGPPTMVYYHPTLTDGELFFWPIGSVSTVLRFTYEMPIEDFDAVGNEPDFPQEWYLTLVWNLAAMLGLEFQVPLQRLSYIQRMARLMLEENLGFDDEHVGSIRIMPDRGGY